MPVIDFVVSSLPWALAILWPALIGVLAVAVSTARFPTSVPLVLAFAVAFALVACLLLALRQASETQVNLLTRDVIALVVIGGHAPCLSFVAARFSRLAEGLLRATVAVVAGLIPILVSPWIVLMVHCTSGDCL